MPHKVFQIDVNYINETGEWGCVIAHVKSQMMMGLTGGNLRKLLQTVIKVVVEKERATRKFPIEEPKILGLNGGPKEIVVPTVNRID